MLYLYYAVNGPFQSFRYTVMADMASQPGLYEPLNSPCDLLSLEVSRRLDKLPVRKCACGGAITHSPIRFPYLISHDGCGK
jgi:hypothetical protein